MYGKKIILFVILSACLFLVSAVASGSDLSKSETSAEHQIYFQDDFSRPDSDDIGSPWIVNNENALHGEHNNILVGAGILEVDNESMAFRYNNHPQKTSSTPAALMGNWKPIAYAPLSEPVRWFPTEMTFTFIPHQDGRIHHDIGLMTINNGFFEKTANIPYYVPNAGIGIRILRTNRVFDNSQMRVFLYEGETQTELALHYSSFQFDSGKEYAVKVVIDRQEMSVEISDGIITDAFTIVTPEISFTPDHLFITDSQGGISSLTAGSGDYRTSFDNFMVSGPFHQVLLPLVLNNSCVSTVASLDVVLLLDISASFTTVHFLFWREKLA